MISSQFFGKLRRPMFEHAVERRSLCPFLACFPCQGTRNQSAMIPGSSCKIEGSYYRPKSWKIEPNAFPNTMAKSGPTNYAIALPMDLIKHIRVVFVKRCDDNARRQGSDLTANAISPGRSLQALCWLKSRIEHRIECQASRVRLDCRFVRRVELKILRRGNAALLDAPLRVHPMWWFGGKYRATILSALFSEQRPR